MTTFCEVCGGLTYDEKPHPLLGRVLCVACLTRATIAAVKATHWELRLLASREGARAAIRELAGLERLYEAVAQREPELV